MTELIASHIGFKPIDTHRLSVEEADETTDLNIRNLFFHYLVFQSLRWEV